MNRFLYFLLLLFAWLTLTWSVDVQNIAAGIIVAFLAAVFFGDLFFANISKMFVPRRIFWFLYYIPVFFIHMVRANIDVAYRVLHVNIPIRPGIVKVSTSMKSDLGLTFLANSITLTPGTLTVDIVDDSLYIHWINIESDDPLVQAEMIVRPFETILKRVFE